MGRSAPVMGHLMGRSAPVMGRSAPEHDPCLLAQQYVAKPVISGNIVARRVYYVKSPGDSGRDQARWPAMGDSGRDQASARRIEARHRQQPGALRFTWCENMQRSNLAFVALVTPLRGLAFSALQRPLRTKLCRLPLVS